MTDALRPQKRARRIAMTPDEVDDYLAAQRTCRVATVGPHGPHVTPLWFCWHGGCIWLYSLTGSRRWAELARDPRAGVVVDDGAGYAELRGVEITGTVAVVGEVPRAGAAVAELDPVERQFAAKYTGGAAMAHDGRHAWLCLSPATLVSWDFRKLISST